MNSAGYFPALDFTSVRVPVATVLESNCRLVYELWDSLRGSNFAPSWKGFDLQRLPPQTISFTRVVDVLHTPFDLKYRFWGTGLVTVLGDERTGKSFAKLPAGRVTQAIAEYEIVIREKKPYALVYNAKTTKPAMPLYAPAIRLPLTDNGETVDKIITYADFNADQNKWLGVFNDQRPEGE